MNLILQCLSEAAGWRNTYFHFFSWCLLCSCQREFNRLERVGRGYNHEIGGKQAMFCGAIMEPYTSKLPKRSDFGRFLTFFSKSSFQLVIIFWVEHPPRSRIYEFFWVRLALRRPFCTIRGIGSVFRWSRIRTRIHFPILDQPPTLLRQNIHLLMWGLSPASTPCTTSSLTVIQARLAIRNHTHKNRTSSY